MAAVPATRESHLVELVDDDGAAIGSISVSSAHEAPGQLHRAFSVILMDPSGRILLQRRSAAKTRFAGRWANACCGHPAPGVAVEESAALRLVEELGTVPVPLEQIGVYVYRAADETTGRVEHEFDHVLLGSVPDDLVLLPDPDEVDALRWVRPDDLRKSLADDPDTYAPWLVGVVAQLP
jgi:isopentenyl-diphosphate Delta-isomerase